MKNKKHILIIAGCILVTLVTAVVFCFAILKKDSDPVFEPDPDLDASVQSDVLEEKPAGIRIPGYPRITIPADTKDVTMNLKNPDGNPCCFTFEIVLTEEDETLYISEKVEPGETITDVTLTRALEKGEYPAMIKITTASLEDGSEMNGANVETLLVVQ